MTQPPDEHARAARNVILVGLVINLFNAIIKIVVGFWAGSYALVAGGMDSLSDLFSDVLVLTASHYGRQRPDKNHPYGHDRYETIATLSIGALLIAVAGALAWSSLMRLFSAQELATPGAVVLVVALASIASKEWVYRYTLVVARRIDSRLLEGNAWHHRTDALSSVVVFVAVAGALLGFPWLDQVAAVIVALMVAWVGCKLIWGSSKELVDTALPQPEIDAIRASACTIPGVKGVHDLRTRSMGSRILLDIHLQVEPHISVSEGHEVGVWVAHRLREDFNQISDVTFHIDLKHDEDTVPDAARLLPLRPEVLARLHQCWEGDDLFEKPHHITLHYLDMCIDVDLFYSTEQLSVDNIEALQIRLAERAADLSWLRRVRVWIGCPEKGRSDG